MKLRQIEILKASWYDIVRIEQDGVTFNFYVMDHLCGIPTLLKVGRAGVTLYEVPEPQHMALGEKWAQESRGQFKRLTTEDYAIFHASSLGDLETLLSSQQARGPKIIDLWGDDEKAHVFKVPEPSAASTMFLRGQDALYSLSREIPNPVLLIRFGKELSLLPSAYRTRDFLRNASRDNFVARPSPDFTELESTLNLAIDELGITQIVVSKLYNEAFDEATEGLSHKEDLIDREEQIEDFSEEYVDRHFDESFGVRMEFETLEKRSALGLLAQQYVNLSDMLDITTNLDAALFFLGSAVNSEGELLHFDVGGDPRGYIIKFRDRAACVFDPKSVGLEKFLLEPMRIQNQDARAFYAPQRTPNFAVSQIECIVAVGPEVYRDFLLRAFEELKGDHFLSDTESLDPKIKSAFVQETLERRFFPGPFEDAFFYSLLRSKHFHLDSELQIVYELAIHEDDYATAGEFLADEEYTREEYWLSPHSARDPFIVWPLF